MTNLKAIYHRIAESGRLNYARCPITDPSKEIPMQMVPAFCLRLTFVATTLLWIGCASTGGSQITYQVEILTKSLKETPELHQLKVELPWNIENPTGAPATVDAIAWTFEIEGQPAVTGVETIGQTIAPKTTDSFSTDIAIPLSSGEEALHSENSEGLWRYRLTAVFQMKTQNGVEEIESAWNGELFPPQPPKISVYAEGARYSYGAYELNFYVTVENPNSFGLHLGGVNYQLAVDGTEIHKGTLGTNRSLGPGVGLEFELSKTVGKREYKDLAKRLRGRSAIPYLFDSQVHAAGLQFPTPIEGELNFEH